MNNYTHGIASALVSTYKGSVLLRSTPAPVGGPYPRSDGVSIACAGFAVYPVNIVDDN